MELNLDTLKHEILEHLESSGFAVFRNTPGGLDGQAMVLWDSAQHPDYRKFLDTARAIGIKIVLFATADFDSQEIDELIGQLDDCGLTREQYRDYESRLRDLRVFEGLTCSLEIAFDHQSRLHVFELQPDWYNEFLNIEDEINARLADAAETGDDDSSLGGYYSKN